MSNTKTKVYLAGLISTEYPESINWRRRAHISFGPYSDYVEVIDPLRDKENLTNLTEDGGLTMTGLTASDIMLRDYHDVMRSDVILVNLYSYGSPRPPMGTLCELAWAWQAHIPIVGIAAENNYVMRHHPFLAVMVNHYFKNPSYACDFIADYYLNFSTRK